MSNKNENKTKPTDNKVSDFLKTLDKQQQTDSKILIDIMGEVSGESPVMWGSSIVGFGSYHYKSKSGREGDWMRIGFSPRKGKVSLYITYDASQYTDILDQMGKYDIGKGCIYLKTIEPLDRSLLEKLIKSAYNSGEFVS